MDRFNSVRFLSLFITGILLTHGLTTASEPEIRTPRPPAAPRINGPAIYGVRPGSPLLYHVPATGERPIEFSGSDLPSGMSLDSKTGQLTGRLEKAGEYRFTLCAKNAKG